jgi:hypothetical protein
MSKKQPNIIEMVPLDDGVPAAAPDDDFLKKLKKEAKKLVETTAPKVPTTEAIPVPQELNDIVNNQTQVPKVLEVTESELKAAVKHAEELKEKKKYDKIKQHEDIAKWNKAFQKAPRYKGPAGRRGGGRKTKRKGGKKKRKTHKKKYKKRKTRRKSYKKKKSRKTKRRR